MGEQPGRLPNPQANDDIDLEPTTLAPPETASRDAAPTEHFWGSASASIVNESSRLLRSRLLAVAGFFLVCHVILSAFGVVSPGSESLALATSLALRALVAGLVFAVLWSPLVLSHRQLRAAEIFLFGVEMLLVLAAQYQINVQLVDRGDLIGTVAYQKNGVLRVVVLMLAYGVFIPNAPRITARVVLTMAIGLIVCHGMVLHHAMNANAIADTVAGRQNVIANALFLLLGAALAVFAAYSLRGLRRELNEARRLGQYQLLEKLGAGGMGEVYLAEHQLLKRPCALKLIHAHMQDSSIATARFEREVQSAAMLSHPNTIEVFDYGHTDDGTFYYVMEYLPGLSVHDLVRQAGPMPPGRAIYLMRQVCGSLAEAHRMGLVHRDLKPPNIFVAVLGGECDVAKVLDFGLVKQQAPADGRQLTADYTVSGTPTYMSPEQAVGAREIDGRADLYSLGAILYFMLTGVPPFDRETPMAMMIAHASEPVRPPSEVSSRVPADLEAVILRCLAKKPEDRFPDARALAAALGACACTSEWDRARAEQWWVDQAAKQAAE
jgi:eukaryotic-like serine/threonine-protein kinase